METIANIPIFEALLIFVAVTIYAGPLFHVLFSRRSHGGAKFGWFIAQFLLPIIAYIVFLILTQSAADSKRRNGV